MPLPPWATELVALYESEASNQFILYGNVSDRFILPLGQSAAVGGLDDFLLKVMMPRFEVVLSYDLGNGIRVEKGSEVFSKWQGARETAEWPRAPRQAVEFLTRYFRYSCNLARLGGECPRIGFVMKAAQLVAPVPQGLNYDLNALAMLIRDWSADDALRAHSLVTWLVADNLNDVHPLIVQNPRAAAVEIPLPSSDELQEGIALLAPRFPRALPAGTDHAPLAKQLTGATLTSVEKLLLLKEHAGQPLADDDLVALKKQLIERDAAGLIEFIEPAKTLSELHGQDALVQWLRQDIALWKQNDLGAMPMGYLICGPVGTGKTYLVECLAGEAGVPVVKLKNFRDKWVGSTEGNLEKVFRLLKALGRCFVFIDEADQALGKRDAGSSSDSGLSGRIYSMFATEMSNTANRGRIAWILASSRPDLIEVDLKRPGRIDVKIPIFPTTTPRESFDLLKALAARRGIAVADDEYSALEPLMPTLLTPGAAETLSVKLYRTIRTTSDTPLQALRAILDGYVNPVPRDVMDAQIALAAREATDVAFIPEPFRRFRE
jgi:hypothetical protein